MVQFAPSPRRNAKNVSVPNWTQRFAPASASRLNRKVSFWTLASSALLLSGSLSHRSEANPPGLSPSLAAKLAAPRTAGPRTAAPVAPVVAPATTPTQPAPATTVVAAVPTPTGVPAPAPAVSVSLPTLAQTPSSAGVPKTASSRGPVLQIDASGAISALPVSPANPSPVAPQPLKTPAPLSDAVSPSLSSSQPQSQPVGAPLEGARGLADSHSLAPEFEGKTADTAVSTAPSPLAATKAAPPAKAASRPKALEVPQMRITVLVGGQERQAQIAVTPKMTVGQALAAMGVSLAILDRVTPEASALARDGIRIRVTRIGSQLRSTRHLIPAQVRYQPTTKIRAGAKATIQQPKAGTLELTERVWLRDGEVTKREFVSQRILDQPRAKIIALGVNSHLMPANVKPHPRYARALSYRGGSPRDRMANRTLAPADPRSFAPVKCMTVLSTGYSAGPAGGSIGDWTATGVRCTYGAVAVDPRLIPLGSKLYIEGYGYGFACDVGGAIKGKHIDLAFDSPQAANDHGRQMVKIWILGP